MSALTVSLLSLLVAVLVPTESTSHPGHFKCFGRTATQHGTPHRDRIVGTPGDDVLVGLGGVDFIRGKGGNDRICGRSGGDLLVGGGSADLLGGGRGMDELVGRDGKDLLQGGRKRDGLFGGCGDDAFFGGRDRDAGLFGDCGPSGQGVVNISLRTGIAMGDGIDTLDGVEDVFASDTAPTVLEGDRHRNTLIAYLGDDQIFGRGGNDFLDGEAGENTNNGGRGRDMCQMPANGEPGATNCED